MNIPLNSLLKYSTKNDENNSLILGFLEYPFVKNTYFN